MPNGFFSEAWKTASATSKRQSKAERTGKPVKKRTTIDGTKRCDLCGRMINDKAVQMAPGEVWCVLCVKYHTVYPTPCVSCDGYYHFLPGITNISDPMHAAMIADMERHESQRASRPRT